MSLSAFVRVRLRFLLRLPGRASAGWCGVGLEVPGVIACRCRRQRECPIENVLHQPGIVAAVADDRLLQLVPERMAGQDAEIAADVGKAMMPRGRPGCERVIRYLNDLTYPSLSRRF